MPVPKVRTIRLTQRRSVATSLRAASRDIADARLHVDAGPRNAPLLLSRTVGRVIEGLSRDWGHVAFAHCGPWLGSGSNRRSNPEPRAPLVGDIGEITGPFDRHDVGGLSLTVSVDFHQPQNPGHTSIPGQRSGVDPPPWRLHPKPAAVSVADRLIFGNNCVVRSEGGAAP
jgi:hypothetical protein